MFVFMQTEEEGYQSSSTEGPDRYFASLKGLSHKMKFFFSDKNLHLYLSFVCASLPSLDKSMLSLYLLL
jgi:hypothetical protein